MVLCSLGHLFTYTHNGQWPSQDTPAVGREEGRCAKLSVLPQLTVPGPLAHPMGHTEEEVLMLLRKRVRSIALELGLGG